MPPKILVSEFLKRFNRALQSKPEQMAELLTPGKVFLKETAADLKKCETMLSASEWREFLSEFLRFHKLRNQGNELLAFEALLMSLKRLVSRLTSELEDDLPGLKAALIALITFSRKWVYRLDTGISGKWSKQLVILLRETFGKIHRDRENFILTIFIATELINLYIKLDTINLSNPVIATLQQSNISEDAEVYPPQIMVPLQYFWSRLLISQEQYKQAADKLEFCTYRIKLSSISPIYQYLIPCKILATGELPKKTILSHRMEHYVEICKAISTGNLNRFNRAFEASEQILLRNGTFLLVEKLKFLCYRQLIRRIACKLIDLQSLQFRLNLNLITEIFGLAENLSRIETVSLLSTLISMNAIKGYISWEFDKIVLSKADPFPAVKNWTW